MSARTFVPPVPPGVPGRPQARAGFRMELPRAVREAVVDADHAQRRRRALATSLPPHRSPSAVTPPLIPTELGRLLGRTAPGVAPR